MEGMGGADRLQGGTPWPAFERRDRIAPAARNLYETMEKLNQRINKLNPVGHLFLIDIQEQLQGCDHLFIRSKIVQDWMELNEVVRQYLLLPFVDDCAILQIGFAGRICGVDAKVGDERFKTCSYLLISHLLNCAPNTSCLRCHRILQEVHSYDTGNLRGTQVAARSSCASH